MKLLHGIKRDVENKSISVEEALESIFSIYLRNEEELTKHKLKITDVGYGCYMLKEDGDYICENERTICLERADEIIKSKT